MRLPLLIVMYCGSLCSMLSASAISSISATSVHDTLTFSSPNPSLNREVVSVTGPLFSIMYNFPATPLSGVPNAYNPGEPIPGGSALGLGFPLGPILAVAPPGGNVTVDGTMYLARFDPIPPGSPCAGAGGLCAASISILPNSAVIPPLPGGTVSVPAAAQGAFSSCVAIVFGPALNCDPTSTIELSNISIDLQGVLSLTFAQVGASEALIKFDFVGEAQTPEPASWVLIVVGAIIAMASTTRLRKLWNLIR
jgi:hypothetical protein